MTSTLGYSFYRKAAWTRFTAIVVHHAPVGAKIVATCSGGGCAKNALKRTARSANVSLAALCGRKLKPGAAIKVTITKPGMITLVKTLKVRRGKAPKVG
jgi:hypothetical protein